LKALTPRNIARVNVFWTSTSDPFLWLNKAPALAGAEYQADNFAGDDKASMSFEQFFSMGGYAFYVWTSYALVLGVLLVNILLPLRRKVEVKNSIARMLKQQRMRP
jgi:heme exporter protein D